MKLFITFAIFFICTSANASTCHERNALAYCFLDNIQLNGESLKNACEVPLKDFIRAYEEWNCGKYPLGIMDLEHPVSLQQAVNTLKRVASMMQQQDSEQISDDNSKIDKLFQELNL